MVQGVTNHRGFYHEHKDCIFLDNRSAVLQPGVRDTLKIDVKMSISFLLNWGDQPGVEPGSQMNTNNDTKTTESAEWLTNPLTSKDDLNYDDDCLW